MLSMSGKKVFLLAVSLLLISLFSNFASAQEGGIGEGLGSAFDTIRQLFAFLPDLITLEGLLGEEPAAIFWAKFLVWLFLFAVVYFGASAIPGMKESKNIAIVIAIVISLMGALLIPNDILVNIFQTYGLLAGIIMWIMPVAAGMFIAHKVTLPFFRALVYGTAAWILWSINATVVEKMVLTDEFHPSFPYFGLLFAVVVIMFFWNLFAIFGGEGAGAAVGGWFGDRGRNAWDWATRDRSGDEGLLGGVRRRGEATRRERQAQGQLESIQNLRQKITETEARLQQYIQDPDIRQRFNNIATLLIELRQVQQAIDAAESEISRREVNVGGKLPIDERRDSYDKLVRRIMDELKRAVADLAKQKNKIMRQRALEIRDIHEGRKEMFKASKEEFYADAEARGKPDFENKKNRIEELDRELERLLGTELQAEGRVYKSHVDYQNAISATIGNLNSLWNYIHQNSGVPTGVGRLFGANKGRRRHLPVEAIYNRISELYVSITKREEEEELNEERFLFFKERIENEADRILEQLEAVTGVRRAVKRPRTARVSGFLSKARRRVEKAPGQVKAGIGDAGLGAVIAKENIERGIGGVIGRWPNPIPGLRKWASGILGISKKLEERTRISKPVWDNKGRVWIDELGGLYMLEPQVEERVNILLRVAQGIRNFNPGKSAKLTGLTNRIRALQARISAKLKLFWETGSFTQIQVEEIAAEVEQDAAEMVQATKEAETELQRAIMDVVATKPTGITREWAEAWLTKVMPDIDVEAAARQIKAKYPQGIKPGVAERTQRQKDTRLHGGSAIPYRRQRGQRRMRPDNWEESKRFGGMFKNRARSKREERSQIEEGLNEYDAWVADIMAGRIEKAEAAAPKARNMAERLLQIAKGVITVNPGKSANLVSIANRIRELTGSIINKLPWVKKGSAAEAEALNAEIKREAQSIGTNVELFRKNFEEELNWEQYQASKAKEEPRETAMAQALRKAGVIK